MREPAATCDHFSHHCTSQGPETDPCAVAKIRRAIEDGFDTSVCLLNYKIDGSTFWNQFFVAPLRDSEGNVVNHVGVQCQVSGDFARAIATKDEPGVEMSMMGEFS